MKHTETRIEKDSMGELKVPKDALYGAQTQRAIENFPISGLTMPRSFIRALGLIKAAAAKVNADLKLLKPEIAIQKATSGPASRLRIKNRGIIAKGNFADIAIFDPQLFRDRATYRNPYRYPAGIEWVLVNGKVAVENGRYIDIKAGKVLRKEA